MCCSTSCRSQPLGALYLIPPTLPAFGPLPCEEFQAPAFRVEGIDEQAKLRRLVRVLAPWDRADTVFQRLEVRLARSTGAEEQEFMPVVVVIAVVGPRFVPHEIRLVGKALGRDDRGE